MNNKDNYGLIALICGIAGLFTGWIFVGIVLGIVAVVMAIQSRKAIGDNTYATIGLIAGIISIVYGLPTAICHCMCTCAVSSIACML